MFIVVRRCDTDEKPLSEALSSELGWMINLETIDNIQKILRDRQLISVEFSCPNPIYPNSLEMVMHGQDCLCFDGG